MLSAVYDPTAQRVKEPRRFGPIGTAPAFVQGPRRRQIHTCEAELSHSQRQIHVFQVNEKALVVSVQPFEYSSAHQRESADYMIHFASFKVVPGRHPMSGKPRKDMGQSKRGRDQASRGWKAR